jgi:hypothetical protein
MQNIEELTIVKRGSIDRIKTTITVKLGTKHRLQELAKKGESFDDVISGLIISSERQANEIEHYRNLLIHYDKDFEKRNIIEASNIERGIDSITLSNGALVQFSYNKPGIPINKFYQMDIQFDKVISTKKEKKNVDRLLKDPYKRILLDLWMVARVINRHFDSAFEISSNKMIIDPVYWRKIKERIGLPENSYKHDIIRLIKEYEEELNE